MSEEIIEKKSKLRREIEDLLKERGIIVEKKISVANLDSDEVYHFDSYPEVLQFLKDKKGRWYITSPGIRYSEKSAKESDLRDR
jgi:hypothetical protein